jgi:hypothetical protein
MAYSKGMLKSSGDKASACFKPFWIGKLSEVPQIMMCTGARPFMNAWLALSHKRLYQPRHQRTTFTGSLQSFNTA